MDINWLLHDTYISRHAKLGKYTTYWMLAK